MTDPTAAQPPPFFFCLCAWVSDHPYPVSQRGVVFFRNQDIDIEGQKHLAEKLGSLAGSPESSGLYCHAVSLSKLGHTVDENGKMDDTVTSLEPESFRKLAKDRTGSRKLASHGWHAE